MKPRRRRLCKALLIIITLGIIYAEFMGDFVSLLNNCKWPSKDGLSVMILADTHILGPINGHWFDKLYREWHMHRAFQAAVFLFHPNVVFILGDLFDEGYIIGNKHFKEHVKRFKRHFYTKPDIQVISAVGNHDIGFHYRLHPYYTSRFENQFNNTGVNLFSFKGIHFVVVNSMAMENDGCYFCEMALDNLTAISEQLNCLKKHNCKDNNLKKIHGEYSQPILMQHFPTYRLSDEVCLEGDIPRIEQYRENWEVLSKSSTELLGELINPRLAFAGHSHHFCRNINHLGIEEYTVASFNWRNKINPSFILAKFSTTEYAVHKCDMMSQETVHNIYAVTLVAALIFIVKLCLNY